LKSGLAAWKNRPTHSMATLSGGFDFLSLHEYQGWISAKALGVVLWHCKDILPGDDSALIASVRKD